MTITIKQITNNVMITTIEIEVKAISVWKNIHIIILLFLGMDGEKAWWGHSGRSYCSSKVKSKYTHLIIYEWFNWKSVQGYKRVKKRRVWGIFWVLNIFSRKWKILKQKLWFRKLKFNETAMRIEDGSYRKKLKSF